MTVRWVTIEAQPIWPQPDQALIPVILWTIGPDGWNMADPVAVIAATAHGTRRLEVAGEDLGQNPDQVTDAGPDDLLFEAERAALTHAVCSAILGAPHDRELWHCAWRDGSIMAPLRTRRLGRLTWHGPTVELVPTAEPPAPCPCPRHRP